MRVNVIMIVAFGRLHELPPPRLSFSTKFHYKTVATRSLMEVSDLITPFSSLFKKQIAFILPRWLLDVS